VKTLFCGNFCIAMGVFPVKLAVAGVDDRKVILVPHIRMNTMVSRSGILRTVLLGFGSVLPLAGASVAWAAMPAQAPTSAPAAARQIGTVKTISGNSFTLTTDAGQAVTISVADAARILQLAPGSTDLKSAQTIALADIAVGDRVLVTGKAGDDAGSLTATRVILMKSSDIAQKNEAEKADWQRRGSGGLVSAVDAGSSTVTISAGAKKIQVQTSGSTKFRRYAGDSVKFEDARPGTLAEIQVGDQLRVRGAKSDDGTTIQAEEIVSGSFRNLAGTIATINATAGTLTLKDLTTKKTMTVTVTANSDLRKLPPEMAARFAARAKGGAAGGSAAGSAGGQASAQSATGGGAPRPGGMGGAGRSAGGDLSQMLGRLPSVTLAELKAGDAVMVVASESGPGNDKVTAVTMLSGVEPILAATPSGTPTMTLSPWSVGGGAPDSGGGGQ
jgi:co-chaperonin GroES (HSP10)